MNLVYWTILAGAFLLEAAGYVAFPYMALNLRDRFGLSEENVGRAFLVALWLRPVWSLLGGYLAERVQPIYIFTIACLAESVCFSILGYGTSSVMAVFGLIIGNMGLSIWSPNLFAIIYKMFSENEVTKRISLLSGALNAGAAMGCLAGALIANRSPQLVFAGAAVLYVVIIPILGGVLKQENKVILNSPLIKWTSKEIFSTFKLSIGIIFVTICFWASYSQFNSFFSLYANDWLGNNAMTGLAFGGVATFVSIFSLLMSKVSNLKKLLFKFSVYSGIAFSIGWLLLTEKPSIKSVIVYVLFISLAESVFTVFLADRWNQLNVQRSTVMQSVNYAFRNIGMGIGSFLGGLFYFAPGFGSLHAWGLQNVALLVIVVVAVVFVSLKQSRLAYEQVQNESSVEMSKWS